MNSGETVNLALTETGTDTGIFTGSYSVTSGSSSGTAIKASYGDTILFHYTTRSSMTLVGLSSSGQSTAMVSSSNNPTATPTATPTITPTPITAKKRRHN